MSESSGQTAAAVAGDGGDDDRKNSEGQQDRRPDGGTAVEEDVAVEDTGSPTGTTGFSTSSARPASTEVAAVRKVRFEGYEDFSARMMLLPRVEEEGRGAVVESFRSSNTCAAFTSSCNEDDLETNPSLDSVELNPFSDDDGEGSSDTSTAKIVGCELIALERHWSTASASDCVNEDEPEPVVEDEDDDGSGDDDQGEEEAREEDKERKQEPTKVTTTVELRDLEFSSILAAIRESPAPIILCFSKPSIDEREPDEPRSKVHEAVASSLGGGNTADACSFQEEKKCDAGDTLVGVEQALSALSFREANGEGSRNDGAENVTPTVEGGDGSSPSSPRSSGNNSLLSDLSSWTSRMRGLKEASSLSYAQQLAADAAASIATAAKERLSSPSPQPAQPAQTSPPQSKPKRRQRSRMAVDDVGGLYLHTSLGAWLSLHSLSSSSVAPTGSPPSELRLTNASMVAARRSETEPCPATSKFTFQWYRSRGRPPNKEGNSRSANDSRVTVATSPKCGDTMDDWILLDGANNAAFQPSAAEVGHRLRCVVTAGYDSDDDAAGPDEEEEDFDNRIICDTQDPVRAAAPLLNGARQALVRGAQFGGLVGLGASQGRSFLLKVEMAIDAATKHPTSAVTIYQVSDRTAEPIHEHPIRGVTAKVGDYSNPKILQLVFTRGIPPSAGMVEALAGDTGVMELQTPSRVARESLLLALGIANYCGEPVDLDSATMLYESPSKRSVLEKVRNSDDTNESKETEIVSDGSSSCSGVVEEGDSSSLRPAEGVDSQTPELVTVARRFMMSNKPPLASSSSDANRAHKRSLSLDPGEYSQVKELEQELKELKSKFERKNKVCSELQRQLGQTGKDLSKSQQRVAYCEHSLNKQSVEKQNLQQSLRLAEKRVSSYEEAQRKLKIDYENKAEVAASTMSAQSLKIAELKKTVRNLQNEKAVLSAAVEARESKLGKMEALQRSFDKLSVKIAENESLREQIEEGSKRYKSMCVELEAAKELDKKRAEELEKTRSQVKELTQRLEEEQAKSNSHHTEHGALQVKIQKLISERNSYKQKGDSLSKEIGRVCRNGRTVRDVEKIIADDASRQQEVELLRDQKRKALDDLEHYRTAYEQLRAAQDMAGVDQDASKVLERIAELERLLSDLTEYVSAKEMQLDTYKQVNEALQSEIRDLAKVNMSKNDV